MTGSPAAALPELGQVVLAEHARILRLFTSLQDRGPASGLAGLRRAWHRLAHLVLVHADAEEEIYYEVLYGQGAPVVAIVDAAIADHDDIRAAVEEANLAEAGSESWWRAVAGAHRACAEHFATEEQQLLEVICAHLTVGAAKLLARQWAIFAAANRPRPRSGAERAGSPNGGSPDPLLSRRRSTQQQRRDGVG